MSWLLSQALFCTSVQLIAANSGPPQFVPYHPTHQLTQPSQHLVSKLPSPGYSQPSVTVPSGGSVTVNCPKAGEACRPRADGCIACSCTSDYGGFCQVRGGNCSLGFFKKEQLTPYEFDIEIELLSDNNHYTGNICEWIQPNVPQVTQGIYPFQTSNTQQTCSNADAINLLDGSLIGIGDDIVDVVSFNKCDPELDSQCHDIDSAPPQSQFPSASHYGLPPTNPPVSFGVGKRETDEDARLLSRTKRATGADQLEYVGVAAGQSHLRSHPATGGGCGSANMCQKRRNGGTVHCCALVFLGNNGGFGCPRRC